MRLDRLLASAWAGCAWLAVALGAASMTGCSFDRMLSRSVLQPTHNEVATPAAAGLSYEDVWIDVDDEVRLHAWFLPSERAEGRTVVLCHGSRANISYLHPYYRFLHDAGFHVFVLDYRGYGRSTGEASVARLLDDLEPVVAHLRQRPDVGQVAWYGISLGSIVALYAGNTYAEETACVVVENTISAHRTLDRQMGAVALWLVETFSLPGGIEAADNAASLRSPVLLLEGVLEGRVGFAAHLDAYARAPAELRSMWIMPRTGHAPHSLLVHDGEYQASVTDFLARSFGGGPARVIATVVDHAAGRLRVAVHRDGTSDRAPWPVELSVVTADGGVAFHRVWLAGLDQEFTLPADEEVVAVGAFRYRAVEGDVQSGTWQPRETALARAGRAWDAMKPLVALLPERGADRNLAENLSSLIAHHEAEGPFHPLLEAQLSGAYLALGRHFWNDDRSRAEAWLRRCVASEPENPALHYWPGRPYVAGFQHHEAVREAERWLAEAAGR